MSIKAKYDPVLELGKEFGVKDGYVEEEAGKLKIGGVAKTQFEKDRMWDKIKEIGGEMPTDIEADIKVEVTDYYAKHTVVSGDTLGKIAKKYYGKAGAYMTIFKANTDQLKNPDLMSAEPIDTEPR